MPRRRSFALLFFFLLTLAASACATRETPTKALVDDYLSTGTSGDSDKTFLALKDRVRKLAEDAVTLSKKGKNDLAQKKIDEARLAILSFGGTDQQREQLSEEYDLLLTLLDDMIDPEARPANDAFTLLLTPGDATAQDLADVEAARSIRSLNRYVSRLSPDARRRVARQLAVFTRSDRGRALFQRYLDRSAAYRDHISRVLAQYKLPAELFYVALIESGFSEGAISRAGAAGMWQFMPATARDYGMQVDRWVDERLDWLRATDSAARYFRDSLNAFDNDIELAVASYNTGVGNVRKAMRRAGGKPDYWDLRLHPETMDYVPKWIAAMIAYNEPKRFGFVVPDDRPVKFEAIGIRGSLDLTTVARAIGAPPETIYDLNRALIRRSTPPDRAWDVRVPAGARDRLLANLDSLMQSSSVVWLAHRMEKGETLAAVAERYGLTIERVAAANPTLQNHLPEEGEVVMLPVAADNPQAMAEIQRQEEEQRLLASLGGPAAPPAPSGGPPPAIGGGPEPPPAKPQPRRVSHKVRLADNLWSIAQRYDVEVDDVREWNKDKLGPGDQIRPGQRLTIWVGGAGRPAEEPKYTVRRGDTLAKIAAQHGVDLKALAAANRITPDSTIYPGAQLRIPGKGQAAAKPAPAAPATHTVGRGETLSSIAARYNVTPGALLSLNRLPDPDSLRVGQTLLIPRDDDAPPPAKAAPRAVHVVKPGETLRKIARRYGVPAKDLASANDLDERDELRAGQKLNIPGKGAAKASQPAGKWVKVKVRRGDTLAALADKYGCTVADLEAWNGLKRAQPLRAGQVLKILAR